MESQKTDSERLRRLYPAIGLTTVSTTSTARFAYVVHFQRINSRSHPLWGKVKTWGAIVVTTAVMGILVAALELKDLSKGSFQT